MKSMDHWNCTLNVSSEPYFCTEHEVYLIEEEPLIAMSKGE